MHCPASQASKKTQCLGGRVCFCFQVEQGNGRTNYCGPVRKILCQSLETYGFHLLLWARLILCNANWQMLHIDVASRESNAAVLAARCSVYRTCYTAAVWRWVSWCIVCVCYVTSLSRSVTTQRLMIRISISEWWIWKDVKGGGPGLIWCNLISGHFSGATEVKDGNPLRLSPGRGWKPGAPQYEAALFNHPARLCVYIWRADCTSVFRWRYSDISAVVFRKSAVILPTERATAFSGRQRTAGQLMGVRQRTVSTAVKMYRTISWYECGKRTS